MTGQPTAPAARRLLAFLFLALVFGLAHTQAPLYYSNQHQYFLHGLARAGQGDLRSDWLANTADPAPLFSGFVSVTHRFLADWLFHAAFLLILGLYCCALIGIFRQLTGNDWFSLAGLLFLTLLVAVHAGLPRLASAHWLGKDYPWYLQAGIAGQYVLGPGLQPSVVGVLFLVAVLARLRGRPWLAVVLSALAAVGHSTYLLEAALFTLTFMLVDWRRGERRRAVLMGAAAFAIVLPVLVYDLWHFVPSSAEMFAEAQRIIAHRRIPHHAEPGKWFDLIAALQVGWMLLAIALTRRTALFSLLAVPFALSVCLTLLQIATDSDTLALLFPWRASAVLVPLATTVIFARLCQSLAPHLERWRTVVRIACGLILAIFVISGIAIMYLGVAYSTNQEELPLLDYIRDHHQPGEVYLLPVEVPKLGTGPKGVISTSFTPPPKRDKQQGLISVDLQRFRLYTGAAIFIDFKSIPYRDAEVLEWWERMQLCQRLYESDDWDRPEVREALARFRITHVVAPAGRPLRAVGLEPVYADEHYRMYRAPPIALP